MSFNIENRRYTGSKAKLSDWIFDLIGKECEGDIFLDIFAGTGVISANASKYFKKIIVNDFLYSNNIIYQAFFLDAKWDEEKVLNLIKKYNELNKEKLIENYFSKNFGNKYFSKTDSKIIGFIREDIETQNLNKKEKAILLASLIYSMDKIANTVGHYDAYRKKIKINDRFKLDIIRPLNMEVEIFQEDANLLAKKIIADIVYIDPPYNSRQYSRFYHVLENITNWKKPKLYGTALKPEPTEMSDYCRVTAPKKFEELINDLNCKYIVVSYNNTYDSKSNSSKNKIELDEIKNILEKKGVTKVFKKNHKHFNAGNTSFNNHQEFIFITRVNHG
jgi:adenine-specific DNA-methyltransferase